MEKKRNTANLMEKRKLKSTDIVDNVRFLGETTCNFLMKMSKRTVLENAEHLSKVKQVYDDVMADDSCNTDRALAAILSAAIKVETKPDQTSSQETADDGASICTSVASDESSGSGQSDSGQFDSGFSTSGQPDSGSGSGQFDSGFSSSSQSDPGYAKNAEVTEPDIRKGKASSGKNESYELKNGELYIFNHYKVKSFPDPRDGTQRDVDALTDTFKTLKYHVNLFNELTKDQVFEELHKIANMDLTNVGCVTIAILTHGGSDGNIHAKDKPYKDTQLIDVFRHSTNETLIGKPIHFFIQACRKYPWTPEQAPIGPHTIPLGPDMLLVHSTYPGNDSFRHEEEGSLFIQELCRVILEYRKEEIHSIIVRALGNIAYKRDKNKNANKRQTPIYTTTLTKDFFFSKMT